MHSMNRVEVQQTWVEFWYTTADQFFFKLYFYLHGAIFFGPFTDCALGGLGGGRGGSVGIVFCLNERWYLLVAVKLCPVEIVVF